MSDSTRPGGAQSGTDRLRETAEEARDAAGEKWSEARREAGETARSAAEEARRRAAGEAERGKRMGAGQVHQWASALDRAAAELGPDSMQGQLLRQASDGLDDVARSIESRSVGEMVEAVADFGRRNPLAFVGGAMMAGFALSRFATASRPGPEWDDEPDYGPSAARRPPSPSPAPPPAPGPTGSPAAGPAATPSPSAGSPTGRAEEGELRLTDSMRPEGGGAGRPYPSAGAVPGTGNRDEEER